jgi:hypothetical protein
VFSFFGSNPLENNLEPVPAKSEPVQLCGCVSFFVVVPAKSELPPKQSVGKNVEQIPPNLSCLQNNPLKNNVEDLAGTRFTLFLSGLFWDQFF